VMARRKALAPTTTSPAKMGEEMAKVQSTSAQSPNVKYVPKRGGKGGSVPREKGAPGRANVQTNDNRVPQSPERLGAKWAPQMMMHSPNPAVGSQETQRNVRVVPSAVGNRDFFLRRQYGQGM
jgi:hypothetical protein